MHNCPGSPPDLTIDRNPSTQRYQDPPLYFDRLLWPAHLKAHAPLFERGDVQTGALLPEPEPKEEQKSTSDAPRAPLYLLEAQSPPGQGPPRSMDDLVDEACAFIVDTLKRGKAQQ